MDRIRFVAVESGPGRGRLGWAPRPGFTHLTPCLWDQPALFSKQTAHGRAKNARDGDARGHAEPVVPPCFFFAICRPGGIAGESLQWVGKWLRLVEGEDAGFAGAWS